MEIETKNDIGKKSSNNSNDYYLFQQSPKRIARQHEEHKLSLTMHYFG